jgi:RNA polymerase sigma factor (TIGR02999 family)
MPEDRESLTTMLAQASEGDAAMRAKVVELIYAELHRLARIAMSRERQGHTMQATELVGEAYLKLFEGAPLQLTDRRHFFNIAARQMRMVLLDHARRGSFSAIKVPVDELFDLGTKPEGFMSELDELLNRLELEDPQAAKVVELRFFGGHTEDEAADILGQNPAQVRRDWAFAKAWLKQRMAG